MRGSPIVMSDVVAELQRIAELAHRSGDPALVEACARAQSLLSRLRNQFVFEVAGAGSLTGVSLLKPSRARAEVGTAGSEAADAA